MYTYIRAEVNSSTIESFAYLVKDRTLTIYFKSGSVYDYFDVDEDSFKSFLNSKSAGKALNHFIKDNFEFSKIEVVEEV